MPNDTPMTWHLLNARKILASLPAHERPFREDEIVGFDELGDWYIEYLGRHGGRHGTPSR